MRYFSNRSTGFTIIGSLGPRCQRRREDEGRPILDRTDSQMAKLKTNRPELPKDFAITCLSRLRLAARKGSLPQRRCHDCCVQS